MFTHSDNQETADRFLSALNELAKASVPTPPTVDLPSPDELELRTEMLPRDAFFGETEQVPVDKAVGRSVRVVAR